MNALLIQMTKSEKIINLKKIMVASYETMIIKYVNLINL